MSTGTVPVVLQAAVCVVVLCCCATTDGADQAVESGEESIVLEIQRLMRPDAAIADEGERNKALLENLRKIPALLEALDEKFPDGKYRAAAHRMGLEAAVMRHAQGDRQATTQAVSVAASRLLDIAGSDRGARAEAIYVLLQMELASIPAPAPAPANQSAMLHVAGEFARLANDFSETPYAPPALLYAGLLQLQLERDADAVSALERLTRNYPKDPYSLKGAVALVRIYELENRPAEALAAKRRCVENFPDSPIALKYRAEIGMAESVGKPFSLRYKSAQGRDVNTRDYRGKTVLVYFLVSVADEKFGPENVKTLKALEALASRHGCVLLAVGADEAPYAQTAAERLAAAGVHAPLLLDPQGKVAEQYGVAMIPSVAVVGPDGTLRGILAAPDILAETRKALSAASVPASLPAAGE